jgi:hypothetical protein
MNEGKVREELDDCISALDVPMPLDSISFELHYAWLNGKHNFVLFTGQTNLETQAGVWCSYIPPRDGEPGVLDMLYATKESRSFMTDLVGLVGLHSLEKYGELPVGSKDVSCHSFPIQERLSHVLGQVPANAVANNEDWFCSIRHLDFWYSLKVAGALQVLPIEDSNAGRQFVLLILKTGKLNPELTAKNHAQSRLYADQRLLNTRALEFAERKYSERIVEVLSSKV